MRNVRLTIAMLAIGSLFAACNKDNYTATPTTGSVSSGTANSYTVNGNGATSAAISPATGEDPGTTTNTNTSFPWKWNTAEAYIANVFVKTVKDGDQAQAQTIELNAKYSLLPSPAVLPSPVLTTGTYTRIDVVANIQNAAAGAITINGVLGEGGPGLPVVIRIEQPMQLTLNAMNKVIGANEQYHVALRVNATALSSTLNDQDAATAKLAGGPIEISKNSNVELYNKVMQNIKNIIIIDLVRG